MAGPEDLKSLPSASGPIAAPEASTPDLPPEQSKISPFPQLHHEAPLLKGAAEHAPWMQPIHNPFGKQDIPNPLAGFVPNPNYKHPYANRPVHAEKNIIPGIENLVRTGASIASLPFARAYEAMHNQGGLVRPETDIPQLGQTAKDIAAYYTNEYVAPLLHAPRPYLTQVLPKHFQQAPVETVMDLASLKGIKAGTGMIKAGIKLDKQIASKFLTPKGKQGLEIVKNALHEKTPAWFEYIKHRLDSPMRKEYANAAKVIDRARLDSFFTAQHELDTAWRALSAAEKKAMHAVLQLTDRDLRKMYQNSPNVKAYADAAKKYAEIVRKTLNVPELIHDKTIYGPQLLSILYRQGKQLKYEDIQGPYIRRLLLLKSRMQKMGLAAPIYVAQIERNVAGHILDDAKNKLMGGLQGKTQRAARSIEKGEIESLYNLPEEDIPGFARERKAASIQETPNGLGLGRFDKQGKPVELANPNDALKARLAQIGQYEAIKQYVRKLLDLQHDTKATKNWEEIPLDQILRGAAQQAGMTSSAAAREVLEAHVNTSIKLPRPIAGMIKSMTVPSGEHTGFTKVFQASNRFQRIGLFGLDPTFGIRLALQTEMLKLMAVKTPKDALAGIVGNLLALHPNAEHAMPTSVMLAHDVHSTPSMLKAGISFMKVLEAKQKVEYGVHNWQRRGFALAEALYKMSNKPASLQRIFTDMLNITKELVAREGGSPRTLELLGQAAAPTYLPRELEKLQKHIKGYLGDYSSQAKQSNWRTAMDFFMITGPWVRHWGNIAMTLPFEHPVKLSIYSSLASIHNMLDADKYGFIHPHDKAGNPILGANGSPKKIKGWELDAIHSSLELAKDIAVFSGGNGEIDVPSSLPIWLNALMDLFGYDVQTRKKFIEENPELHHPSNTEIRKFKAKHPGESIKYSYIDKAGNKVDSDLPTPWYVAKQAFPKQINPLTELSARKGNQLLVPSPYTYPGHPAPKTRFIGKGRAGRQVPIKRDWEDFYAKLLGVSIRD